jgi:AraC-like DNA-binding protein
MRDWSPKDAIALERRHIVEGEQQVARQEMLLRQVTTWGRENLIDDATEVRLLQEAVDLSRARLRDLEDRYPRRP